ncbi:MAG: UPF0175 family protein [Cyanobacteria bacterium J06592_8]
MKLTLDIPDILASRVQEKWDNLPEKVLEIIVAEAYKSELITRAEVGRILNLPHRLQVDKFLKQAGVYLQYELEDFEQDLEILKQLEQQESELT